MKLQKALNWNEDINYPVIALPPMDGITDFAFREMISDYGGSDIFYTEFVNVQALIHSNPKTLKELKFSEKQRPIVIQLFGSNPEHFYDASQIAVELGFNAIDINMGCPSHKIASKGGGCALMGDYENAQKIVKATYLGANKVWKRMKGNGEIQVSTKMRLGVSDKNTVLEYAPRMADVGSKVISIHGRTLKQMYTGEADWNNIKKVKDYFVKNNLEVKVFGSGDVKTLTGALKNLIEFNVDGVLIGRGSFGKLWMFDKEYIGKLKKEYLSVKEGRSSLKKSLLELGKLDDEINSVDIERVCDSVLKQSRYAYLDKKEKGIIQMRKHLAWYFNSFRNASEYRARLVRVNSIEEIDDVLNDIKKEFTY